MWCRLLLRLRLRLRLWLRLRRRLLLRRLRLELTVLLSLVIRGSRIHVGPCYHIQRLNIKVGL